VTTTFALELDGISKRFGAVVALSGTTVRVRSGSIHAVLGENGAGKTTLMRIAYGSLRPDAGEIRIFGNPVTLKSSADALARGVGMVHQHFTLVPAMTVAENVALGMRGVYDAGAAAERVRSLGRRTGLVLEPDALVATLPVGAQQRLEIVKALARNVRVLILDEPTAVLAPSEADDLLAWVARFRDQGGAAVLITHKLREARLVADDVTVLHRGATVLTGRTSDLDEGTLVSALVGDGAGPQTTTSGVRPISDLAPTSAPPAAAHTRGAAIAVLRNVSIRASRGAMALRAVSLEAFGGEVLGIAAVEGSGQHELVRVLAGRLVPTEGGVQLPADIAFVPEDRQRDALVLEMSLTENVALRGLSDRTGRMPWTQLHATTDQLLSSFDVRSRGATSLAGELSGGNQQKLVLGRELSTHPPLLVAENPTRGLDIRATAAVLQHLRAARAAGSAVVVYSSDLDEVLSIADRVVVVHAGEVTMVEPPSRERVGRAMLGAI